MYLLILRMDKAFISKKKNHVTYLIIGVYLFIYLFIVIFCQF